MSAGVALVVRRTIAAEPRRVFEAWTEPAHLLAWWGPRPVRCSKAEVDLRIGGRYRIVNLLPDGNEIVIDGEFTVIEPFVKLAYTWTVSPGPASVELVTVKFEARGEQTEVIVIHEKIGTQAARDSHEGGWVGCLEGLERYFAT